MVADDMLSDVTPTASSGADVRPNRFFLRLDCAGAVIEPELLADNQIRHPERLRDGPYETAATNDHPSVIRCQRPIR